MADPKSITELKPGSNYLIVYNRGDMSKEDVVALSEGLSNMVGALGASCTLVVVPDGCSVNVSEVPSAAEVVALLRSVEWVHSECPSCGCASYYGDGHEKDCKLNAMIKRCEAAAAPRPAPYSPRPPRMVG
jgi:hypothetical protein